MNHEKLYESFCALDDAILERSERASVKNKKRTWIKWCAMAACFVTVIAGAAVLSVPHSDSGRWPVKEMQRPRREEGEIGTPVPKWEEMPVSQQFLHVQIAGVKYSSRVTEISAQRITEPLGRAVLRGRDIYTDTVYEAAASVYGIAGISRSCAVALQFEGRETYYAYVNADYRPDTLGQFIKDLGLRQNLSFGSVWYHWEKPSGKYALVEFTGLQAQAVWELLLSDPSLTAVKDYDSGKFIDAMGISVNIPLLGYKNISLGVTADGYLTTNILDTGKAFYIGEEAANRFMEYVFAHCEGFEIKYAASDGKDVPE